MTKKNKKIIEKVVMGAVIGGAIGSVVGASIKKGKNAAPAPKKKRNIIVRLVLSLLPGRKKRTMKKIPLEKQ